MIEPELDDYVCKPIDTYVEILEFAKSPPQWTKLCKKLDPESHSSKAIKNIDLCPEPKQITLESPYSFCHIRACSVDKPRHDRKHLPKTLVCHDMGNNYHDDSYIHGTSRYNAYTFCNWAAVDIYCYFSHHLITIPPVSWINVGHAHGTKVIGTIITEWTQGQLFWERALSSKKSMMDLAIALVNIADSLCFDGYLLNVENKVKEPEKLIDFVSMLYTMLHSRLHDAVLIWYDSVTKEGHLSWQNQLNDKNKVFFDACDGFFLNYSWRESDLRASVAAAGARHHDLYVGIDVWGRNFYGGGQFNTQQAVKLAHSLGCSMAIFAPAWTYEALGADEEPLTDGDPQAVLLGTHLSKYECCLLRDRALWSSLWPYLTTRVPRALPFQTSFCRGQGLRRSHHGEVLCPSPWYNLRHQQYQPNASHGTHGYVLSTQGRLLAASYVEARAPQDRAGGGAGVGSGSGILRIRQSLHQLIGVDPDELQARAGSLVSANDDTDTIVTYDDAPRRGCRKRVADALKGFCAKLRCESQESDAGPSATGAAAAGERTRSMVHQSLALQLGQHSGGGTRLALAFVDGELQCLEPWFEDSFTGGSCLRVNPCDEASALHRTARLLHAAWACAPALAVAVATKPLEEAPAQALHAVLLGRRGEAPARATLLGRAAPPGPPPPADGPSLLVPPLQPGGDQMKALRAYLMLNHPGFYVPIDNCFGWNVRYYVVHAPGFEVTSVNVRPDLSSGAILLGHFGVCAYSPQWASRAPSPAHPAPQLASVQPARSPPPSPAPNPAPKLASAPPARSPPPPVAPSVAPSPVPLVAPLPTPTAPSTLAPTAMSTPAPQRTALCATACCTSPQPTTEVARQPLRQSVASTAQPETLSRSTSTSQLFRDYNTAGDAAPPSPAVARPSAPPPMPIVVAAPPTVAASSIGTSSIASSIAPPAVAVPAPKVTPAQSPPPRTCGAPGCNSPNCQHG